MNILKIDSINSNDEAFAAGMISLNDMVIYGNIIILESAKIMFYYKVFNAFDKIIMLEGILEFNENQMAEAAKLFTNELY